MRTLVILVSCMLVFAQAQAAPRLSLGTGLEVRAQREVNPEMADPQVMGSLFVQARWLSTSLQLELARHQTESSSGALQVSTQSWHAGLWGRYFFVHERAWTPFVGLGLGLWREDVTTSLLGTSVHREGWRKTMGVGAGVNRVFWQQMLLELEVRVAGEEDQIRPQYSGHVRLGWQF